MTSKLFARDMRAGQTGGLIDEVARCEDVTETVVNEAETIIGSRLPAYLA